MRTPIEKGRPSLPAQRPIQCGRSQPEAPRDTPAHAREPVCRRPAHVPGKAAQWVGTAVYGKALSEIADDFWVLVSLPSLRCARNRQAGEQKRDHGRAGRKLLSHSSQRRLSACAGVSVSCLLADGISTSSATGDETQFCLAPLPRKSPSGRSLYLTRRKGWSRSP